MDHVPPQYIESMPASFASAPWAAAREGQPYTLLILPRHRLVKVVPTGFWAEPEANGLGHTLTGAIKALGCTPGTHRLLFDVTRAGIQSQSVLASIQAVLTQHATRPVRLAVVAGSLVNRSQARRLATAHPAGQLFAQESDALVWLLTDA